MRTTYDLVFSQGIIRLDVFSRTTRVMCFWSRRRPVIFEGGKLHERVFLMRNFRECVFWWRNLGERVFSHVWIIWHYACHMCFFARSNYLTLCMPYRYTKRGPDWLFEYGRVKATAINKLGIEALTPAVCDNLKSRCVSIACRHTVKLDDR